MADFDKSVDSTAAVAEERAYDVPPSGLVIFFNDDYTTKDFVVEVLVSVFHKSEAEANALMEAVHTNGSAAIGVYAFDIAATRASIAVSRARAQGFPLMVKVQEIR
ncbi:MAG: ATP-dependent Clp protease adaptor ClpS [Treponema sp.]|nr:ATP-dependent Clp protease adaptor ClpS [Treponema sp.]